VAEHWTRRLEGLADVLTRADAVRLGLFGPVSPDVLPRIGDVLVLCRPGLAVVDSRHQRPQLLALIGLHGSLTPAESLVPLLSLDGPA
jgi:hypothetical protein